MKTAPHGNALPTATVRAPAENFLRDREFMLVWGSGSVLWVCRWVEWVVLALLVLELTDSDFQVALVGVFSWVPMLVFSPFSGFIADRFERWHVLVVGHVSGVLVTALLLGLIAADLIRPWHVFLGAAILGWIFALDWAARFTFISDMVGPKNLVRAVSMQTASFAVGSLLGGVIAGFLIELDGFRGPYLFLIAAHPVGLFLISLVKSRSGRAAISPEPALQGIVTGLRYALRHKIILAALGCMVVVNFTGTSAMALYPVVAKEKLDVGPGLIGVLISAHGIGALLAAGVVSVWGITRHLGRIFATACAFWLLGLLAFALSSWYPVSFLALLVLGIAQSTYFLLQVSIMILAAEPEMRGRALGAAGICVGMTPLGTLLLGAVANVSSTPTAVTFFALSGLALIAIIVATTPLVWRPIGRATGATLHQG